VTTGIIIAAPASGSGKTVLTLGLLRLLTRMGASVASAKVGPDYIDPAFHGAATGRACLNLDTWAMRGQTLASAISELSANAELIICEGVMGLFDGATARTGSTADLAALTGWPVVLVIDVRAQAASAAAVIRGFASHRTDVRVAGAIFNRVGSQRHASVIEDACSQTIPEVTRLGSIPRDEHLRLPERHLGLVQAGEHPDLLSFLDRAADLVAETVDVDTLRALASPWRGQAENIANETIAPPIPPIGQRLAVARDAAFSFAYPLSLNRWRAAGAEVIPFSPLANEPPDPCADAVYLPGGYPELHAGQLAGNDVFLSGLRNAAGNGAAVFGECGGYMVLGNGLMDAKGSPHAMAGLLPLVTSFADRGLHLGYRQASLVSDGPLGLSGTSFRGHEFHYARTVEEGPGEALFTCADAIGTELGPTGLIRGRVFGSFVHLIDQDAPGSI